MDFDAWHHWLFLRPLFVFVLACPLLILAVFVGSHRERRDAKRARKEEAGRAPPAINDESHREYESARSASQTPDEWRTAPPKANRVRHVA